MTLPNSLSNSVESLTRTQVASADGVNSSGLLTRREQEILAWIAQGKSDASIGQILDISAKTVNYHVENAKRKFAVATRIQAVLAAMGQNLIQR
jgi:DNA-binding CsgD family transcriptional regulator